MIATIQNISSSKFSLNGLEYNKSFIALKVGDNYIRIVSVYDTRLELVGTTHFNQVQVAGTVHTSANNLINALTDVLFSKAESSGGGLEPGGDFTGTLNVGTGSTVKYNDYLSGSAVSLALSTSKVAGSYATIRIKGSLTGSWPSTWKVSGDPKSSSSSEFNELSIAYLADDDIRGVNRVYSISGAPVGDTTAPSVPTALTSPAKTSTTVDLSWTASTDAVGVTGYVIYKNGVYEKEVGGTTAQVTGLTASTAYSFTVAAIDAAGNESAQSSALSVTTNAASAPASNYTAVWTLDKIDNPSYSGASIQVARLDGSILNQDIGFVGDELDTAAIDAMAGSDSVLVTKIYDKSGNGNHFSFVDGSKPVIKAGGVAVFTQGGKPAIKFSGLNARLEASATLTAESGLTVFVVHYNDTTTGNNKGIFGKWNGTGNEYLLASRHFASPDDVSFVSQDSASVQNNLQSGTVLSTKALRLFTTLYNPATSTKSLRINGTEVGTATADIRASDAPLQLGGYDGDTNDTMFISEMRLAKTYLTDFATRESAIKTKYGIS